RFTEDGSTIQALVRPWDEELAGGKGDPFDLVFKISLTYDPVASFTQIDEQQIASQIGNQVPRSEKNTDADFGRPLAEAEVEREITRAFKLDRLRRRSPIWDVALTGPDTVGMVHDGCLLEIYDREGKPRRSFTGEGHGAQILRGRNPIVHVTHFDRA